MIAVITVGFSVLTLEWFSVVPALAGIHDSLGGTLTSAAMLVSVFFFGYGIAHVPVGLLAAATGPKAVFVGGLAVISTATLLCGLVTGYPLLLVLRAVAGFGAAAIAGTGFQLGAAWSTAARRKLALGVIGGPGFTVGAALGLYAMVYVHRALGWQGGLLLAGAVGLLVTAGTALVVRAPAGDRQLHGGRLHLAGVRRTLGSRDLWAIGLGSAGAYGAFFTISELGPGYAHTALGVSAPAAAALSAAVLLAGLPGGIVGGLVTDRARRYLPVMALPAAVIAVLAAALPFTRGVGVWVVEIGVGFLLIALFTPASAAPAEYPLDRADYATGVGLVLMLCNVGAVIDPLVYARVSQAAGATAGWLAVAGIGALSWLGYLAAREPRQVTAAVRPAPVPDPVLP
jgi:predicted MFS family arabinose efflux permease